MYDLGILTESWEEFPYFLVIRDENGHLVQGPKSAKIIRDTILRITGGGKA